MGIIVFLFDNIISGFGISIIARCALDAFIGFVIYLILSVIVKNKSFDYLINIIKVRK